jgi:hypothetical protein
VLTSSLDVNLSKEAIRGIFDESRVLANAARAVDALAD